jgi:hypothetical protein
MFTTQKKNIYKKNWSVFTSFGDFFFQKIIEFVIKTFPKSRNSVKISHPK